jgi:hypothetical protein
MGFQTGTQVDPRLLDYSGYAQGMTQAAAITGAMLANIGKEIGEKREEQKQKKATIGLMKDMIKSVPEFQQLTGMDNVIDPTDADLNTAAKKLYDTLGDDMSQKVTLLALTSLFEDDDDDDVDPTTVMKFQELAETDPMIKLGKTGQLMRQTADKGSIFNPFDLLSALTSGKELNIFGDDPFMDVPISDPLIKNIKGGEEFQNQECTILLV